MTTQKTKERCQDNLKNTGGTDRTFDDINLEGYELAHQVRYTYTNKTGQLSQTINTQYLPYFAQHITEFEYDEQYRLIAEIQDGERIEVELDKYGRQTALLLPNGVESAVKISQGFNQYGELTQFQVNNHNPLNLSYDKLGRQTRKQNQNGFILAEHFSPSGLLQAQGGGWNNSLTEQQLSDYQPNQTYPIAGTQISRKWQYDKAFNLVHTQDNHWGATEYRVNKNGQVTDVLNGLRHSEHYRYDSQLNLTQKAQRETDALGQYQFEAANDASFGMKQRNGRITRFGNKTYKYDELGRLHSKTETKKGFRPVTTYYKWNSQSQLVELHSPFKGSWRYEYDSFGRRITKYQIQTDQPQPNQVINMPIRANQDYWHKINELWAKEEQSQGEKTSQNLTALSGYRYLYKQNQLVAEAPLQITSTEGNLALTQANWADAIYWLYQEDDFTPTARYEKGQLHYTVVDQVGTITELLTEDGYIDYRQKLNLWGEAEIDGHRHYAANDSNPLKCNHRFVGQYYDDESELHYNRFRYYSPETGQYISHDPIGLLGGFNPYGYVGIPTAFVDPLGLDVRDGNGRTHVTYRGVKTEGKRKGYYTGYASADTNLGLTPEQIVARRYNDDFSLFGGRAPTPIYSGKDSEGKNTARGLEQKGYEYDIETYGKDQVANAQNPVGEKNPKKSDYEKAANKELADPDSVAGKLLSCKG